MKEIGYHITRKGNLPNIQKKGLEPKIGRRSNSVNESNKILCFFTNLGAIHIWKERLYKDIPYEELAILSFDLDGIEYIKRIDSAGDFFTLSSIPPENINVIQFTQVSEDQYKMKQGKLTEMSLEDCLKDKGEIIDELADYEHKKWSTNQHSILWKSKWNEDGSYEISQEDIERIQKYGNLDYSQVDEIYKSEIHNSVLETFYIMEENNILDKLELSEEEIISVLERTEHMRRNNWNEYMLSLCTVQAGKYIIPEERVKWWKKEIVTSFYDLSDNLKEYDRIEVYNIFSEIEKYKAEKNKNELKTAPSVPEDTGR